jgi:hypothetical protein
MEMLVMFRYERLHGMCRYTRVFVCACVHVHEYIQPYVHRLLHIYTNFCFVCVIMHTH